MIYNTTFMMCGQEKKVNKKTLDKIALVHIIHIEHKFIARRCGLFQIDLKTRVPIYKQVLDNFKRLVYSGKLTQGERIPSIRDLAKTLGVNPNTVQKAYRELEEKGLFYTIQGQGSFIAAPSEAIAMEEIKKLYGKLLIIINELSMYGVKNSEIIRYIEDNAHIENGLQQNIEMTQEEGGSPLPASSAKRVSREG